MPSSSRFGERLRGDRIAARLSQEELAAQSGVSVRAISDLERGRTRWPHPGAVHRLADALDLRDPARAEFISAASRRLPAASPESAEPAGNGQAVPKQLPPAVPAFTGRTSELATLSRVLARPGSTAVITAIGGTAGVGKTTLAIRWAREKAGSFPDGQLYVNLRGYDTGPPVLPGDALAGFLRALGMPGQDVPLDAEERAGAYRSLVAERRILIVLDNASREDQVRPLLPGTPSCTVLVTSRNALPGLVARDGAARLDLDLLPMSDALALLRELIGDRVDTENTAAVTLAEQCCRLPLALRVAAELISAMPSLTLADLTSDLADLQQRLDRLDAGGDPTTAVRAVFSWSYKTLDEEAARFFRLAGLHPGPDLDEHAAAALSRTSLRRARHLLDQLTRAGLMQQVGHGRFGMHDLLRAYARELVADDDQERRAALTALLDYYLYTAAAAMDVMYPGEAKHRPRIAKFTGPVPSLDSPATAQAWLDAERANLVIVSSYAADDEVWHRYTAQLAATLLRYLDNFAHYADAITLYSAARCAARQAGDAVAEARSLTSLAAIDHRFERYAQSADNLSQAIVLSRSAQDRAGEARALGNLSMSEFNQGLYRQAARHLRQALKYFQETADLSGEARVLGILAGIDTHQGRYRQAERRLRRARRLCHAAGDHSGEVQILANLGIAAVREGSHELAVGYLKQALADSRELGFRAGEAEILLYLGVAELRRGDHAEASRQLELALALWHELRSKRGKASALNGLGEIALAEGRFDLARTHFTQALQLADKASARDEEARAHGGLGTADRAAGEDKGARSHWEQALVLYTQLGAPEADHAQAQLSSLLCS